ncbi:hypothetical protein HZS36_13945 [Kalamiella piersonii]|nr:hypothetical protein [Pantoea piersonii]NYB07393.1 hypothetical protein [Pantoea piersonii]NYB35182.1 hypothetical protein [Pantoea piersonii]
MRRLLRLLLILLCFFFRFFAGHMMAYGATCCRTGNGVILDMPRRSAHRSAFKAAFCFSLGSDGHQQAKSDN